MNTTELMIGDWVYRPACYDRVKEIHTEGIIGNDPLRGLISISEVEPIPLIEEILKKNGWVWNDLPFEQCWTQYGLYLYSVGNGYRINCGSNVSMIIDFVHQLQHALKLCGIDKTIEI